MEKNENPVNGTSVCLADLCYVYAKSKWMRTFKAFDLDGFFVGNLIYASMIADNSENRQKLQKTADDYKGQRLAFQLRRNGKVVFETRAA